MLMIIAIPAQKLKAQVLGEFTSIEIMENMPYQSIIDSTPVEIGENFALPPNYLTKDLDNGYYAGPNNTGVPLGFEYEFNGEVYDRIFINVNGFITFGQIENGVLKQPPFLALAAKTPTALFYEDPTYPVNVIAPFWGDHMYRTVASSFSGFAPTKIMYKAYADRFVVEWKDLNINYELDGEEIKSSVANFQVIIYKSKFTYSKQGNIEFAYGQVNTNNTSGDSRVITQGASVGVKGEGIVAGGDADYLNGLAHDQTLEQASESKQLTQAWTPSGGTDKRIAFIAASSSNVEEWWGDGDVDFSKVPGNKHHGLPQSRFVTFNDARIVMNSVATGVPLDPVRRRAAYHADVNHDGRYYIDDQGVRKNIPWRNAYYADSLPNEVSSLKQILFDANEEDAAYIIMYMGNHVIELPWLLDTIIRSGKVSAPVSIAEGIVFGNVEKINDLYQIPVFLTGAHDGKLSAKFKMNNEIVNVVENKQSSDNKLMTSFGTNIVALAGYGKYSSDEPIMTVYVKATSELINATEVRFNNEDAENISIVSSIDGNDVETQQVSTVPNPLSNNTTISVNIPKTANYKAAIYDILGNEIKMLSNDVLESGLRTFEWNRTDNSGNRVNTGVYFYRLEGNNMVISQKLIVE